MNARQQSGVVLLEALIAILIFSMGILAIVGLQAAAVKNAGDAKYRSDASLLVNQLVGQMLVSNRSSLANLQAAFQNPSGTSYVPWASGVAAALPGVSAASGTMPTVVIVQAGLTSGNAPSNQATITVRWQAPNDAATHSYTAIAQIR